MKQLTDEQREILHNEFCSGCCVYGGEVHVPIEAFDLVPKLISSEQAAREEAENERILSSRIVEKTSKEITRLEFQLNQAVEVLKLAQYIMSFHTMRCPMDIMNNFSGMEEHLAMYRHVLKRLEPFKGKIDWKELEKDMSTLSQEGEKEPEPECKHGYRLTSFCTQCIDEEDKAKDWHRQFRNDMCGGDADGAEM